MPWGAAIGAAASLGSAYMSNKGSKKNAADAAANQGAPWAKQQPYVLEGYKGASDALTKAQAMGDYQGSYTADMNPWQTQGYNSAAGFAQDQGTQGANTVFGAGMANIGAASRFGGNAEAMFQRAQQDPTGQIINNAGQYANNPYLNGQIDAASRDVMRNLGENQMTGLDLSAAGSGNMDSSRTGVAQGIMQRGAGDRIADISSQMRGQAYGNGLGMAQDQFNQSTGQMMNANGQLLQSGQFGADQIGNGLNLGYGAGDVMARAGQGFQSQEQMALDGQRQQYNDRRNGGLDLIGKYMSSINGNYSGGATPQVKAPDYFGAAASGAMGGMALYGKWNAGQPSGGGASNVTPNPTGGGDMGGWGSESVTKFGGYA